MVEQLKQVEAYECPRCSKVTIGSREEAEDHLQTQGVVLPTGLVFWHGGVYGIPERHQYNVIVKSELNQDHNSKNLHYTLGTGEYALFRRGEQVRYGPKGFIGGINGRSFSFSFYRLLEQEEFDQVIKKLKEADLEMVKKELQFLNETEGGRGAWMTQPGYAYSKENPSRPNTRIDRAMLERHGWGIEDLIRTTPELEQFAYPHN